MKLTHGVVEYWLDGGTRRYCNPDPPSPDEARPFVVRIANEGWYPVNVLVFARDTAHAESRVRLAMDTAMKKDYMAKSRHLWRVREQLNSGKLTLSVAPYDIKDITSVPLADNDTL